MRGDFAGLDEQLVFLVDGSDRRRERAFVIRRFLPVARGEMCVGEARESARVLRVTLGRAREEIGGGVLIAERGLDVGEKN